MRLLLLQVTAPHFCAGAKVHDQIIVSAAPIIRYMERWHVDKAIQYARSKGWKAVLLPTLIAFMLVASALQAAPLDLPALRDAICLRESRTEALPAVATGDNGASRGECQIGVDTAVWMIPWAVRRRFVPAYMRAMLMDRAALTFIIHYPPVNRGLALAYLARMYEQGLRTPARLAYAFNAGHNSTFGSRPAALAYALEIVVMLAGPPPVPASKPSRP